MNQIVSRRSLVAGAVGLAGTMALTATASSSTQAQATEAALQAAQPAPRYVFLFIGDGMSYPQIQATSYYRASLQAAEGSEPSIAPLNFMGFPTVGAQNTYDSTSVCPDSASTATAIASGHRTASGTIGVSPDGSESFETIAEQLKAQRGYNIAVITSVNLNHATPAAFYAHQQSRRSYYEIAEELVASGFDFFAGGDFLKPCGPDGDRDDIREVARQAGYTVTSTYADAAALTCEDLPAIAISEVLADDDAISYELDRAPGEWALADYVCRAVELLADDGDGLFLMCEGGKIDWACHANDCAATMNDVLAFEAAVQVAVDFYSEHPDETLIVVTGDHETGGLTIGYAETNYDTYLPNFASQKISYARFDSDYVTDYVVEQTPFEDVLADVEELFGLTVAAPGVEVEKGSLVLTACELELLRQAYERTVAQLPAAQDQMTQQEYVHYGTYEPFTVTLTHLLNNKSGVDFATYSHSGLTVPVYALGCGAEAFGGTYDNTQIYEKLAVLTGVQ